MGFGDRLKFELKASILIYVEKSAWQSECKFKIEVVDAVATSLSIKELPLRHQDDMRQSITEHRFSIYFIDSNGREMDVF